MSDRARNKDKAIIKSLQKSSRYCWILDPGHGGLKDGIYQTNGKRSPIWEDGSIYYEGVGNREIVQKVAGKLDDLGIDYEYTVEPEDPTDIGLKARVDFINRLPYKNKIGISVHSNGASIEQANGWEVYTSPGLTKSDQLATVFFDRFKAKFPDRKFRKDTKDGDVDKEANFYIIAKSTCPFILLENFFHTNEDECKNILMSEEGQNKIVEAIVEAIIIIEEDGL